MNELPFIARAEILSSHIKQIQQNRKLNKKKEVRRYRLSTQDKIAILEKTNYKCHICGGTVAMNAFEADHVEAHSATLNNKIDNFLPACRTCNNYKWHYSPEEIRWILKLGVFFMGQIRDNSPFGKMAGEQFIKHEIRREGRRKQVRI